MVGERVKRQRKERERRKKKERQKERKKERTKERKNEGKKERKMGKKTEAKERRRSGSLSLSSEIKLLRCCLGRSRAKEKIVKVMAARGRRASYLACPI